MTGDTTKKLDMLLMTCHVKLQLLTSVFLGKKYLEYSIYHNDNKLDLMKLASPWLLLLVIFLL